LIYQIANKTQDVVITKKASFASSFWLKSKGLMFKKKLSEDEVLFFKKAPSIHTCFMHFPIDIVFLDKNKRIIKITKALKPWRMTHCFKSSFTLEFSAEKAKKIPLRLGDILEFSPSA